MCIVRIYNFQPPRPAVQELIIGQRIRCIKWRMLIAIFMDEILIGSQIQKFGYYKLTKDEIFNIHHNININPKRYLLKNKKLI